MSKCFILIVVCYTFSFFFFENCNNSSNREKKQEKIFKNKSGDIIKKSEYVYINDVGWTIPDLSSAEKNKTSEIQIKDEFGNKRKVEATDFTLSNIITEEPYNLIGYSFGKIKISSFRELKISNKTFAYLLTAQRVKYNETERKFIQFGLYITFCYLDENGDGKFETLLNDPENDLLIPKWLL